MSLRATWSWRIPRRGLVQPALAAQVMDAALGQAARTLSLLADAEVTRRTPVDRGQLRGAWQPSVDRQGRTWRAVVTNPLVYAGPVDMGQRPHWPPIAPLEAWGRRVLGKRGLGYVLARKIARHGTKPVHMVKHGLEAVRGRAQAIVAAALHRAGGQL